MTELNLDGCLLLNDQSVLKYAVFFRDTEQLRLITLGLTVIE